MYKEFRPSVLLQRYVDAYWVSAHAGATVRALRILPDSCADIIFHTGGGMLAGDGLVIGTMTVYNDVIALPGAALLGIRFKPGGLSAYCRLPMAALTDQRYTLRDLSLRQFYMLQERLAGLTDLALQLRCVEEWLLAYLPDVHPDTQRVWAALSALRAAEGKCTIPTLAQAVYMSPRSFERVFLREVGVSAKEMGGIFRFLAAKRLLKDPAGGTLLEIALAAGYYDHAHFTKAFRRYAGQSPSERR
ncbi:helix-turn-helix domain-containing protein [Chitinophaga pendula]|uniref:helix-turn-helix domain-containing protein n=1 Tax=Chitinophaga TaxID=79328 RepID=UPI000BB0A461|nr:MULTISPECIES: helix-turn-helix domain-containing protein [Chitinophaga]ASZ10459.1 hypothetical protein CK934_05450 [Chitinophaga sp. MD30]UCJ06570.1 helix-turn-helix domain-containing protein [Chitinophaga pendula]